MSRKIIGITVGTTLSPNSIKDKMASQLEEYATKDFVTDKISEAQLGGGSGESVDLSEYLTETEAEGLYQPKGQYLTEHQTLKTINGESLVGEGDITIVGGENGVVDVSNKVDKDGVGQVGIENLNFVNMTCADAKNLFNESDPDYLPTKRLSPSTGEPTTQDEGKWSTSGFIPVVAGETYVFSAAVVSTGARQNKTATARWFLFDSEKKFVKQLYNDGVTSRTIEDGIAYVRISHSTSNNKPQLEVGTEMTEYEEYGVGGEATYTIPAKYLELPVNNETDGDSATLYANKPLNLPSTIHAFVNQPIVIYFHNIMDYNENDVYIRVVSNNRGTQGKRTWTYTPDKAETFTLRIEVYDHNYDLLNNESFSVVVTDTSAASELTVLVIGASTVNEGTETNTMRSLAEADNFPVTFLGTRATESGAAQHEGRGGWGTEMYCTLATNTSGTVQNAFYNPDTKTFDFAYYMTTQGYTGVDCVFLQIGINDLFAAKTDAELATKEETYFHYLKVMIDSIYAYDSNIKVILNTLPPPNKDEDKFAEYYPLNQMSWRHRHNMYIANRHMLTEQMKDYKDLYVSWYGAVLDCDNVMSDGVHPTTEGYVAFGTQMYSVMRALN